MKITKKRLNRVIENYLFEGKYPYVNDKKTSDMFRSWMADNHDGEGRPYFIDREGSTTWKNLSKAYDKFGKEFEAERELTRKNKEQDESYFGLGYYLPDYEAEDLESQGSASQEKTRVEYHEKLPQEYQLASIKDISKGKETFVKKCKQGGCAAWVASIVGFQGNAWHAHRGNIQYTAFEGSNITSNLSEITSLFNKCNKNPKEHAYEKSIKSLLKKMIPNQSQFSNIPLGSVVGLWYPGSHNFTKAFYEGATGTVNMGVGYNPSDPAGKIGNFVTKESKKPWHPDYAGTNVQFVPSDDLASGEGFGMNTHLGYVGAYVDGKPVIFHNIGPAGRETGGRVYATPFSLLSSKKLAIYWYKDTAPAGWFDRFF